METHAGNAPFVFVSYAHKDSTIVLPLIRGLQKRGCRVWYDEGVEVGNEWPDFIAEHLEASACVLVCISQNYGESNNCRDELGFAKELEKDIIAICLEDRKKLRAGVRMRISTLHAMDYDHTKVEELLDKLSRAAVLKPCTDTNIASTKPTVEKALPATKERDMGKNSVKQAKTAATPIIVPDEKTIEQAGELLLQAERLWNQQSYDQAFPLFQKAAELGNASAQNYLGECFYCSRGTTGDYREAVKWYRSAAEQGNANAQFSLGYCYENGTGVERNIPEAAKWYRKSAAQKHKRALAKAQKYAWIST